MVGPGSDLRGVRGHSGLTLPSASPVSTEALWPGAPGIPGRRTWLSPQPQPPGEHTAAGCHQYPGEIGRQGQISRVQELCPSQEPAPAFGPPSQVIDGFFVKRTADIKESAAYLALLTRGLERLYQVSNSTCLALPLPWVLAIPREVRSVRPPIV